jgi:hypothetical protein
MGAPIGQWLQAIDTVDHRLILFRPGDLHDFSDCFFKNKSCKVPRSLLSMT